MSAGIETLIWLALKSRIQSLPTAYAKAWPGMPFDMPSSGGKLLPFLRIGRVNSTPVGPFIEYGKPHQRNGFLMVTLVYPLGQDVSVYDQQAALIASHFADGTQMRADKICVTVTGYPQVQEGYEDIAYWNTPVRIPWQCFA